MLQNFASYRRIILQTTQYTFAESFSAKERRIIHSDAIKVLLEYKERVNYINHYLHKLLLLLIRISSYINVQADICPY